MTTATNPQPRPCPSFDWCIYDWAGHKEHVWTDGAPADAQGQPGTVYAWTRVDETGEDADDVLIGIGRGDDESWGAEGTLTIEDAEYLRDVLDKAIRYARRHQSSEPVVER
jgi:hypothetical protein